MNQLWKKFLCALVLCSVLAALSGCGNYVGKEKSNPLFVKAAACRDSGDFVEAARYYREFLNVCPTSPLAHYEIATVYCDSLDDPFQAIYHYNRCLELGGIGSTDDAAVRDSIEFAKKKAFQILCKVYEPADAVRTREEAAKLKKHYDQYVDYSNKLRLSLDKYVVFANSLKKQNAEMREMLRKAKQPAVVQAAPEAPENADTAKPGTPEAAGNVALSNTVTKSADTPVRPNDGWGNTETVAASPTSSAANLPAGRSVKGQTPSPGSASQREGTQYTVRAGDSLYRISKNLYGSPKYYQMILKANADKVGANGNLLRPGQILTIPKLPAKEGGAQ